MFNRTAAAAPVARGRRISSGPLVGNNEGRSGGNHGRRRPRDPVVTSHAPQHRRAQQREEVEGQESDPPCESAGAAGHLPVVLVSPAAGLNGRHPGDRHEQPGHEPEVQQEGHQEGREQPRPGQDAEPPPVEPEASPPDGRAHEQQPVEQQHGPHRLLAGAAPVLRPADAIRSDHRHEQRRRGHERHGEAVAKELERRRRCLSPVSAFVLPVREKARINIVVFVRLEIVQRQVWGPSLFEREGLEHRGSPQPREGRDARAVAPEESQEWRGKLAAAAADLSHEGLRRRGGVDVEDEGVEEALDLVRVLV